ncbi:4-hydroxyphenylpyruvate dioxygenase [Streptomyces formicae]|uniref:4-hydroxyphenylpyruvate dioxygenase n=2 Tax=Streptomyces formicae TaxID=1616117 RepID=A0A291Q2V7_9ACTN|nr:4-hydroxyphenylpyruvate dioxygenase [Streptomyces formicae]
MQEFSSNTADSGPNLAYVEFYVRDAAATAAELRHKYGFETCAKAGSARSGSDHYSLALRQGNITLVVTQGEAAHAYVERHGDGVADIAFQVDDVRAAFAAAVRAGARVVREPGDSDGGDAAVAVFGDIVHSLLDRAMSLPPEFSDAPEFSDHSADAAARTGGFEDLDHFAVCVEAGELGGLVEFWQRAFGFRSVFQEHISVGSQAMNSEVVQNAGGDVTFTIIEPDLRARPGQINEFLEAHQGPGIQHLALSTRNIVETLDRLSTQGVETLNVPDMYYDALPERVTVTEYAIGSLRKSRILVDEDHNGRLFQVFTRSVHPRGTFFFEVLERCGAETFGSNNIHALYAAVESERVASEVAEVTQAVCLDDLAQQAATQLPRDVWDFIEGGSGRETTLAHNRTALDGVRLVPRVLADVSRPRTATRLLGVDADMPVAVAPMAYHALVHPEGELATARAAAAAGVPLVAGMLSSRPLEQIAREGRPPLLQLYWLRDRAQLLRLVRRAEEIGCPGLMLTVDAPRMGRRLRDLRRRFVLPSHVRPVNLDEDLRPGTGADTGTGTGIGTGGRAPTVAEHTDAVFDASLSWPDLEWLREQTALPLLLKGVLDPADAARAASAGIDAIVVSNHGGRQLDGAVAAVAALPAVCAAVEGACDVLLDSGIRSGTDVLRALALGAKGVLLGRPVLWGLAVGGEQGVGEVFSLLKQEIEDALALSGCPGPEAARGLAAVLDGSDRTTRSASREAAPCTETC